MAQTAVKRKGMIKKDKEGGLSAAVAEDDDPLAEDAALEAALWVEEGIVLKGGRRSVYPLF